MGSTDISHWLERGARNVGEASDAQRMQELMQVISEGAFEAAWQEGLAPLLKPSVEQLLAGRKPDLEIKNPFAARADEVPRALRELAEVAGRHHIWLREADDPRDFLWVIHEAF